MRLISHSISIPFLSSPLLSNAPLPPPAEREALSINQPLAPVDWDSVTLGSVCFQIGPLCPQVTSALPVWHPWYLLAVEENWKLHQSLKQTHGSRSFDFFFSNWSVFSTRVWKENGCFCQSVIIVLHSQSTGKCYIEISHRFHGEAVIPIMLHLDKTRVWAELDLLSLPREQQLVS